VNRISIFFLVVVSPILALMLAWLGWLTHKTNLLGWFLLVAGLGYAAGVLVRYWILHDRFWNPRSGGTFSAEEKGDRSFWLIMPGMGVPLFLSPVEYLALPPLLPHTTAVQIIGAGLVVSAWLLFGEARRMIRSSYSGHLVVTESQKLVQSGPYRLVRHPSYLSFILMTAGIALGYSSLISVAVILVVLVPGLVYRIRVEEGLLEEHFQDEWRGYAARTKKLIPGVW